MIRRHSNRTPASLAALLVVVVVVGLALVAPMTPARARGDYPKPSPYPISWELNFDHGSPKRIVVTVPGDANPTAYWYVTYKITNNTDKERIFYPVFEMLTGEGKVTRSDFNIPPAVFDAVKARERNKFLESSLQIGGEIRLGEDQARDGVAIWREPMQRMGTFSIFVSGLWGENVVVKGPDGKDVRLRKTLQLTYHVAGADDVRPGEDEVNEQDTDWVMR